MKNRIKQIRKDSGLNQTDFGKALGLKQSAIAGYESGARSPIDAVIVSICKEFNISETWLRTGEGEMHQPVSIDEQIIEWIGRMQISEDVTFQKRVALALAQMTEEGWTELEKLCKAIVERD